MHVLKNKPNKLIIVYHQDDKMSMSMATILYEKGFDNIYMVTGGIEEFYQKAPNCVVGPNKPQLQSDLGNFELMV